MLIIMMINIRKLIRTQSHICSFAPGVTRPSDNNADDHPDAPFFHTRPSDDNTGPLSVKRLQPYDADHGNPGYCADNHRSVESC